MEYLLDHIYKELDKFAGKYDGSPFADEIITFKIKISQWMPNKKKGIYDYFRCPSPPSPLSLVCKYCSLKLRVTIYNNGYFRIYLSHKNESKVFIRDKYTMSEYCVDIGYVYFIESEFGWKIGKTKDLANRKSVFDVKLPFNYAVRMVVRTPHKSKLENNLHEYFKEKRINGEWFLITTSDIESYFKTNDEYKLSPYPPDDKIEIEQKYLLQIA